MKKTLPFLIVVALAACGKEEAPPAKIERPALTHVVGTQAAHAGNIYSGEIRARHEVQLGFRIGGKIVERLVDAGETVKAGQPLARLDAADTALQASAAESQYQLAEADAKRYRELRARGFVSQAALDAKETALKAAAAQAGLARNQAAYTTLRADRSGVVAATLAEAGQVVSAGQPVLRVAQEGEREVAISIPESQLAGLKLGAPAEITLWASDGETRFTGRLRELAPAADSVSRTYPARVALDKVAAGLALGMTASVSFGGADKNGRFIVPLTAIFQQGDKSAVWIVEADRSLSLRPVQVAAYRDDGAVIAGGLAAGERIVGAGVHKLSVGEKIRIVESGAK
ncbi:multidrug transporter [Ferrigenium kumadai]|uniref:Multidrug transporter n=1 Tax=Ferrigenium kumadai TaxID=1682490 RepID=A0AAN1VZ16_9PROT|nr:efflux RND transporter periplasmic adaptor subunit [Ferrigenium kumadai]BBI98824.1 multidrug transporter [Ferrigenium kumadai]